MNALIWWSVTLSLVALNMLWLLLWIGTRAAARDERFVLSPSTAPDLEGEPPLVSIIIPARNEAGSIGHAVRSALAQNWSRLELIVIDDNSTDGTTEEARIAADGDPRLHLISGTPLPEGWMGKCWALWQAQREASGALLLFVDADVKLSPEAVRCAVAMLETEKLDLLSLWGRWVVGSFWERVAQPVVGGFVRGAHPLEQVNDPNHPSVFANGQFILIRRSSYDAFGGHEHLRSEVLEDVRFAQAIRESGMRGGMFLAQELFSVRLYTSLKELWFGSVKNFYHGMDKRPGIALIAAMFIMCTTLSPWICLAVAAVSHEYEWLGLAGACIGQSYLFRFFQDRLFDMDPRFGVTHPLGSLILTGIIIQSAWRGISGRSTSWKGRPV